MGYTSAATALSTSVQLSQNEHIKRIDLDFTQGQTFPTRLEVHTTIRTLGPYGATSGNHYKTAGNTLLFAEGRSGSMVDQVTLYYDTCV